MANQETAPDGAPCWADVMTSDIERTTGFYCDLFGWVAEAPAESYGGYVNFARDGVRVAGAVHGQSAAGATEAWSVYLATTDVQKTLDVGTARGGQVLVTADAVGDLGTMAFLGDPGGAAVGLWQAGSHHGFGAFGEPGTPSWFELRTRHYAAAVEFYRDVFGWEFHVESDTPEFRYATARVGGLPLAGVMDASAVLADGVPAHWSVYFGVADTDAAVAMTTELGGAVLAPAEDTPYGRVAMVADPTGAQFRLVAANDAMPGPDGAA